MEIHPTEMSHGENEYQEVQRLGEKISDGAQKTEFLFSSSCIYRVPNELRKLKESAYTPRLIAIGPLHRNDPHLQTPMQHVKLSYANNLLCRVTGRIEDPESAERKKFAVLQDCVAAMKTSLDDAKKCYAEEVALDVEMMLVDGCFILEFLFRRGWGREARSSVGADPIFADSMTRIIIQHDLLLLENQIPFLVLERLFPLTLARIPNHLNKNLSLTNYVVLPWVDRQMRPAKGNSTNCGSTETSCWSRARRLWVWVWGKNMNYTKAEEKVPNEEVVSSEKEDSTNTGCAKTSSWTGDCIRWVSGNKMNNSKPEEKVPSKEVVSSKPEVSSGNAKRYCHILHKLHDDYFPHDQTGKGKRGTEDLPSASELVYAGVKFKRGTGANLFEVKFIEPEGPFRWFRSAQFEIPPLRISDLTEPLLRNFTAFEQCRPGISEHFTSYVTLMDMLVNSDTDVQVLENAGVVRNWLGASDDVSNLLNNLRKEVVIPEFLFADTCNRATMYSKRFWPKNMAYLRRQYFASPWKFMAFCLAFVYFGVTIAQLVISVIK